MSTVQGALTMQDWLATAAKAAEELTKGQLGYDEFEIGGPVTDAEVTDVGSYVALVGDEGSAQIGLIASIEGCRSLAKKMLCMEDGEELEDSDMCDAVGEMANILGGATKRLISERVPGFKLGLPLFMQGRLLASDQQEVGMVEIRIGPVPAHLIVVRHKGE